eukprot:ANDGO_03557.mRNA.1 hypothetical protein
MFSYPIPPSMTTSFLEEMEEAATEKRRAYQGRLRKMVYAACIVVSFFWPAVVMTFNALMASPVQTFEFVTVFLSYFFVNGFMTAILLDYWALYQVYRIRSLSMHLGTAVVGVLIVLMVISGFEALSIFVTGIAVYGLWPIQQSIPIGANVIPNLSYMSSVSNGTVKGGKNRFRRSIRLFIIRFNWRITLLMILISLAFVATVVTLWMAAPRMPTPICEEQGARRPRDYIGGDAEHHVVYPICSMAWKDLDMVDAALFSETVYWPLDIGKTFITKWYGDGRMVLTKHSKDTDRIGFRAYFDTETNLTVIAVRGTQTLSDLFQDIDLYAEIGMLQFFSVFMPSVFILPRNFVSSLVLFASYLDPLLLVQRRHYHHEFIERVREFVDDLEVGRVVFTGHSLGGAIGQIIGTQLNIPAVTFSAPGNLYSALKFDMSPQLANHLAVNVAPDGDPVPLIDFQAGLVQKINCPSFLMCHLMLNTLRELMLSCRSPVELRKFNKLFCELRPLGD